MGTTYGILHMHCLSTCIRQHSQWYHYSPGNYVPLASPSASRCQCLSGRALRWPKTSGSSESALIGLVIWHRHLFLWHLLVDASVASMLALNAKFVRDNAQYTNTLYIMHLVKVAAIINYLLPYLFIVIYSMSLD